MRTLYPLTQEEQEFATAHFDLVNAFLRSRRLPENEYYDVVIFGYIEAVEVHCRNPLPIEKQNFRAFAFNCMQNSILLDLEYRNREMRRGCTISLDRPASEDNDSPLFEIIPDTRVNVEAQVELRDQFYVALATATKKERMVFEAVCAGYPLEDIARSLGLEYQTSREYLYLFRKKMRDAEKGIMYDRRTKQKSYYEANRQKIREKQRLYREKNRERINDKQRARRAKEREEKRRPHTQPAGQSVCV